MTGTGDGASDAVVNACVVVVVVVVARLALLLVFPPRAKCSFSSLSRNFIAAVAYGDGMSNVRVFCGGVTGDSSPAA
jgi:hypothetical protein